MGRVRNSYDTVAQRYAEAYADELDDAPLERGLLRCFAEFSARVDGPVADVGCGPGHVTLHLTDLGCDTRGIDLSPRMIEIARSRHPDLKFDTGSFLELPAGDGEWAGAVALYSIIHLAPEERTAAYRELARAVRPGGALLVSFHVSDPEHPPGSVKHLAEWWDHPVDLDTYFLDPAAIANGLADAGFTLNARIEAEAEPGQYPSRRAYLLATR